MKLYTIDAGGKVDPVPDDDRFVTPYGIAVEPSGDILAVDRVTHRLRRVKTGGKVEDVADIRAPRAILFDKDGNVVVLTDKALVRVSGPKITPIAATTPFEFPHDAVLHPDGNFYVTDGYAHGIWRVSPDGKVAALVKGEPLKSPQGIAVDPKGNLLVADAHAKAIFSITPKGEVSTLAK
jgi:sugar lactone lactonase YvrE